MMIDFDFVSDYLSDETYDKIAEEKPNGDLIYHQTIDGTLEHLKKTLEELGQDGEVMIRFRSK